MIGLDIVLLPEELKSKNILDCLVVVIDVLRASSSITTALASGASKVIPVYLPGEARKKSKKFRPDEVLLCGERNGERLAGFNLGNSPLEYNNTMVKEKIILLTTTNGIRTIELVQKAKKVIIGCFLNIHAIVHYCNSYAGKVLLVCAGDRGNVSLEDTVCAGMMMSLSENHSQKYDFQYDDSMIASYMYRKFNNSIITMMQKSVWGKHLIEMGLRQDLVFCAQENVYNLIPIIKGDSIVVHD